MNDGKWAALYAWLGEQADAADAEAEANENAINLDENVGLEAMADAFREVQRKMRRMEAKS